MHDVARVAGVSQTTVSFVLNGRDEAGIAEETKARIAQAVQQLGYRPNAMAQALRRGTTNLLGLITDEIITTPHAVEIIKGAQDAAQAAGKLLVILTVGHDMKGLDQAVEVMIEHRVEGIILATMYHREIQIPPILENIPLVLADCFSSVKSVPALIPDDFRGGFEAVTHLLEQGHTRIGFVTNSDNIPAAHLRLAGYREALTAHGVAFDEDLVVYSPGGTQAGGYEATVKLLSAAGRQRPTALFCFNDRMAMGAYVALNELGLSIPDDMSVMGFDNQLMLSAHLRPGLTTLQLPHYQIGRMSVEQLLHGEPQTEWTLLHCPLIQRDSVVPIPQKRRRLGRKTAAAKSS
ncbi:LacI family DNA-binding transcriptional regulator [Deinococcus hopiensis]|nr:LacI family DNA-binding transcriptional regulator [Deinococcus hopiensis]